MQESSEGPNIAVVYDFDGTLAPGNMQEGRFIPRVGLTKEQFWGTVQQHSELHRSDPTLAYMHVMLETAREKGLRITRQDLAGWAANIRFFPGIPEWFERTTAYGRSQTARIQHHVISCGNSEIIEATPVAHHLTSIFGSRFVFDGQDAAVWPGEAVNFTTKTQHLFRINKDATLPGQREDVNRHIPQEDRPFPFENIVYIGDGETDIPCFSLVESKGGLAIAVYTPGHRDTATEFLKQGRVNAIAPADYQENNTLDLLLKRFIDLVTARHRFRCATAATHQDGAPKTQRQESVGT